MQNEQLLEEITRRFDAAVKTVRGDFDTAVKTVHGDLDSAVTAVRGDFDTAVKTVRCDFALAVTDLKNHADAKVEDLTDQVRMVVGGHPLLVEKMGALGGRMATVENKVETLEVAVVALHTEMRAGDQALHEELSAFRAEVRGEFAEVRRVTRLEATVGEVVARVDRLEKRAAG